nr:hypothetical protein [Micromonospora sp. DSM 115978]
MAVPWQRSGSEVANFAAMCAAAVPADAGSAEPPSHRRYDPLRGRWVVVSAGRTRRPWAGDLDRAAAPAVPRHDPACPLCPGNSRPAGQRNPEYAGPYVFDNDFPALRPAT